MKSRFLGLAISLAMAATQSADAELIDRGNGMIYDSVQDITWLQDANYAKTEFASNPNRINEIIATVRTVSGHVLAPGDFNPTNGRMSWWGALAWADQLVFGGFDDWRLPDMVQPDLTCQLQAGDFSYGHLCQASEMGYLFYNYLNDPNLGNAVIGVKKMGNQVTVNGITLQNIQPHHWTSMENWLDVNNAFFFPFNGQGLATNLKSALQVQGAWAVRDGDVLPPPAPVSAVNVVSAKWKRNINKLIVNGTVIFDESLTDEKKQALLADNKLVVRDALSKANLADTVSVGADGTWKAVIRSTRRDVSCQVDAVFVDQTSSVSLVARAPSRCGNP